MDAAEQWEPDEARASRPVLRARAVVKFRRATHRVITCTSATEARVALVVASRVLKELGVNINPQKTRIVHVRHGFEFLGTRSSAAVGRCGCRRARSELVPDRGRYMRFPGRNRSVTSGIRYAGSRGATLR